MFPNNRIRGGLKSKKAYVRGLREFILQEEDQLMAEIVIEKQLHAETG